MKLIYSLITLFALITTAAYSQSLTFKGFIKVPEDQPVLFGADTSGIGNKLIWYAKKGAFRAGTVSYSSLSEGQQWNSENVGQYSFAAGENTLASGRGSMAMGYRAKASGLYSTALGYYTTADGPYSTALGANASTNGTKGSLVIGDASIGGNSLQSDTDNQFAARFASGYKFYTSYDLSVGAYLGPGQTAWSTLSDSTRKERFTNTNGDQVLSKISTMRLGSWNYKGQIPQNNRHYGPMAQDFFTAFGEDAVGTIGNSTTINQADFDGINLIAIQALIHRVERLEAENKTLREINAQQQDTFKQEAILLHAEMKQIRAYLSRSNTASQVVGK